MRDLDDGGVTQRREGQGPVGPALGMSGLEESPVDLEDDVEERFKAVVRRWARASSVTAGDSWQ